MLISRLLKPSLINLNLKSTKRTNAIYETASLLNGHPSLLNFEGFYQELLARERVETTCIGNSIAFPHARTDHVKSLILAVGRSNEGILFENCNQIVRLIFVIGTPKRMTTEYLTVVGALARILKDPSNREALLKAEKPEDFLQIIEDFEGKL
ncbi:MAG: PTS sugar transporter subunit IIA [Methylacidiphilales bacterium]|nr:PTS sugar transporter subunit IIA [Candidatus Methylacidiphilales bacterium]MDW8349644.1 PTS sugar transporter subunit IIA [Verrucomicrobiae bacterium]